MGADDRMKQIILSRRARFVAAALVGVSATTCASKPQVCLEISCDDQNPACSPPDASADATDGGDEGG